MTIANRSVSLNGKWRILCSLTRIHKWKCWLCMIKRKILNESDFRYQEQHCGWIANRSRFFPSLSKCWKTIILLIYYDLLRRYEYCFSYQEFPFLGLFSDTSLIPNTLRFAKRTRGKIFRTPCVRSRVQI